ncbi:twin arginine-targeting protein translocase TatC [Actinomyces johnsonii F0510]|uniref:Sec-independent protein translocase protein TatC n=1 Tax=Actinomyces johnsonii F0510 TaxID=1227262 RepID=U1PHR1_9ACTO|nr:twin arginine-targeting protein translocase TatC [Actinomyces johnsonii F0510]
MVPKLPQIKRSRRKDNPEARMSIGDHLRELRQRLFVSAAGVMVMTVVGYLLYERAFALITRPIEQANAKGANLTLNFDTILASFDMKLEVSIWLGVLLSSPLWMYEFWAFVGPGMTRKEKAYTWAYGTAGLLLFLAGAALGIWVMPHAVSILTSFIPDGPTAGVIGANLYLSFVMRLILVFGIAFLLPELLVALNMLGLMQGKTMLKGWRWAIMGIVTFMAIANPLPDPWSMVFMSVPIAGLYFLACFISIQHDKRVERKRDELDAELEAALAE